LDTGPGKGLKGGNQQSKHCSRNKGGGHPLYRPVPASGHHNKGNQNFTRRQAKCQKTSNMSILPRPKIGASIPIGRL
jgi:ribosomal protein L15